MLRRAEGSYIQLARWNARRIRTWSKRWSLRMCHSGSRNAVRNSKNFSSRVKWCGKIWDHLPAARICEPFREYIRAMGSLRQYLKREFKFQGSERRLRTANTRTRNPRRKQGLDSGSRRFRLLYLKVHSRVGNHFFSRRGVM